MFDWTRFRTKQDPLFSRGSECAKGDTEPATFHNLWRQPLKSQEVCLSLMDRVKNEYKRLREKFRSMGTMEHDHFSIYKSCQKYMYAFHRYEWHTDLIFLLCLHFFGFVHRAVPEQVESLKASEKGARFAYYPKLVSNQVRLAQKKDISLAEKFLGAFGGMTQWLTHYCVDRMTQGGKRKHDYVDEDLSSPSTKSMFQLNFIDACLHCFPYSIIRFVYLACELSFYFFCL